MSNATLDDLYIEGSELPATTLMSERAKRRREQALWYAWGRDDAGNSPLSELPNFYVMGNDFGFADYAALEAERFERGMTYYLSSVQGQFNTYVQFLLVIDIVTPQS